MSKKVGWSFWWLWLIANIFGSTILPMLIWQDAFEGRSRIFLTEILQGAGISITQSLVLRDRFAKEGWWLPLTLIGWSFGLAIVFCITTQSMRSSINAPLMVMLPLDFTIVGLSVGICQWQLLKSFRAAGLWLLASVMALLVSTYGALLGYMVGSMVLASTLQGGIYGAITGLAMIKVLRSPKVKK